MNALYAVKRTGSTSRLIIKRSDFLCSMVTKMYTLKESVLIVAHRKNLPVLRKIVCTPQLLDCFFKSVIKTNVNQLPFSF